MAISRYSRNNIIAGGTRFGTARAGLVIQSAIANNQILYKRIVMRESDRLDVVAGREYEDSSLWWVIAAASKIGWNLQVPAGTVLTIPTDLSQVAVLVG